MNTRGFISVAFLLFSLFFASAGHAAETVSYYGVYIRDNKLGSLILRRDDTASYAGKPAVLSESSLSVDMRVLGTPTQIKSVTTSWTETQTGHPIAVKTVSESGGATSSVSATYTKNSVTYIANVTGSEKTGTLTLKPGETFAFDPVATSGPELRVGKVIKGKVFQADPALLNLVDSEVVVTGKETIIVGNQAMSAFVLKDKNPTAPATLYLSEAGELLRTDTILGMQIRREPKEIALSPPGKATDIVSLVGVKPTGKPLTDPRRLTVAQYEIKNVTRVLPKNDTIQQVTYPNGNPSGDADAEAKSAIVTVTTGPLPVGKTASRFTKKTNVPARLRPFLQSTLYVQSDDLEFQEQAKRIVGSEKETGRAAAKIAAYVYKIMKADPAISNLRAAKDILRDPRGVCRDYTLLFTTLARATGIPTKQCVGLAYAGGAFLGHAWPEVWTGTDKNGVDRWVALEPTWNAPFADATHIKLSEGEITDFFAVASDLGKLEIDVRSAK